MIQRLAFLITIAILIACGLHVTAQVNPEPTVKSPSLDDFLAAAHGALSIANDDGVRSDVVDVAEAEFIKRYLPTATYAERRRAFETLQVEFGYPPVRYPQIDPDQWIAWILDAWLAENPVDLDALTELRFDDFDATITQQDFNGDGQHDWLLDLTKGISPDHFEYRNWMVVTREDGKYRAVTVPSWPGWDNSWDFPTAYSEQPHTIKFVDVTGDGIPEWFIGRAVSPWGNIPGQTYQELVLSWLDGHLVNVMSSSNEVQMANLDSDPAQEFYTQAQQYDSWGCTTNTQTIYDWNGTEFAQLNQPIIQKKGCEARQAEEAMWRGDFQTAVQNYNTFLAANRQSYTDYNDCLSRGMDDCGDIEGSDYIAIYNYFLSRRVIAYALLGEKPEVAASLDALQEVRYRDGLGLAMLAANSADPEKLCLAAYNFFAKPHVQYGEFSSTLGVFTPGAVYEDVGVGRRSPVFFSGYRYDPIKAGCDIRIFEPQSSATPTPLPSASPGSTYTPYPTPNADQILLQKDPSTYFRNGDYTTALWIAEHANQRRYIPPDEPFKMQYWRALSLEALGRNAEAAAAYDQLAEMAAGTAWAGLADLHLEQKAGS